MSHPPPLAGITAPCQVYLVGRAGQDDLVLYADDTAPMAGAKLFSREGYRAGEIALAYVDPEGTILHRDAPCGVLRDLTVLFPLSDYELDGLEADRARRMAARGGVESEPDWYRAKPTDLQEVTLPGPWRSGTGAPVPALKDLAVEQRLLVSGALHGETTYTLTAHQTGLEQPASRRAEKTEVEIFGERYTLWSTESAEMLGQVAAMMNAAFGRLFGGCPPLPPARAAVLVAVAVAAELFKELETARQCADEAACCDRTSPPACLRRVGSCRHRRWDRRATGRGSTRR
jgi:cell division protein ZapA (FtsZ GTPase activity inhibitor)